jgi:hypothetical protein
MLMVFLGRFSNNNSRDTTKNCFVGLKNEFGHNKKFLATLGLVLLRPSQLLLLFVMLLLVNCCSETYGSLL